jgi:hypothetical protein
MHKLKTTKEHELKADQTIYTMQKSRTHVFKIHHLVNLHGFKYVYKQRNINVFFSQCGS